jgi:hypothetical protein
MFLFELAILNSGLIGANSFDDQNSICLRIARRSHGTVWHPPEDEDGPEAGDAAEQDEKKLPGFEDWGVDMAHSIGEETTDDSLNAVL